MGETENTAGSQRQYPLIDSVCLGLKNFLREVEPSEEVCQHFRNARVEVLKGLRQMIDNRIERLSRDEQQGQKITVE